MSLFIFNIMIDTSELKPISCFPIVPFVFVLLSCSCCLLFNGLFFSNSIMSLVI